MKRVKLITSKITNSVINKQEPDFQLDYKKEYSRVVEIVPEGCTASQMGMAIKVADKINNTPAGEFLILEDAEMDFLRDKMKAAKFGFVAPELVTMVEALEKAETIETPHLKSEKASV